MDSGRERILGTLHYVALAGLLLFLCFCLHSNFDVTDEGFYLYHYIHGSEVSSFNFYHIFISPIGAIFSHKLLFYRYLSVLLLTLLPFLFIRLGTSWVAGGICFALFYFNQLATFSYNTISLAALFGSLFILLNWKILTHKFLSSLAFGLICFLVSSARPAPGVLALILGCFYFGKISGRNYFLSAIGGFIAPALMLSVFWNEGLENTLANIHAIRESSHQGMLGKYFIQTGYFLLKSFIPALIVCGVAWKWSGARLLSVAYFLWITLNKFFLQNDPTGYGFYLSGLVLAWCFIEVLYWRKTLPDNWEWTVFPIVFFFMSAVGTNNNLFKVISYNMILLFPFIAHQIQVKVPSWRTPLLFICLFIAAGGIFRNQFLKTYRNLPRSMQTQIPSQFPVLKGISIDQNYEKKLVGINQRLRELGFDFKRDRVFAYPNLPGIFSVLGIRPLGGPWNNTSYEGAWRTSCLLADLDRWKEGKLFVILSEPLPQELHACLGKRNVSMVTIQVEKFR